MPDDLSPHWTASTIGPGARNFSGIGGIRPALTETLSVLAVSHPCSKQDQLERSAYIEVIPNGLNRPSPAPKNFRAQQKNPGKQKLLARITWVQFKSETLRIDLEVGRNGLFACASTKSAPEAKVALATSRCTAWANHQSTTCFD